MWIIYDTLTNLAEPQISFFCCSKWIWTYKISRNGKNYSFSEFLFISNIKASKFWKQKKNKEKHGRVCIRWPIHFCSLAFKKDRIAVGKQKVNHSLFIFIKILPIIRLVNSCAVHKLKLSMIHHIWRRYPDPSILK